MLFFEDEPLLVVREEDPPFDEDDLDEELRPLADELVLLDAPEEDDFFAVDFLGADSSTSSKI